MMRTLRSIMRSLKPTTWSRETLLRQWVQELLTVVSFWCTVILPFIYLPLLVAGLDSVTRVVAFFGLLALNLVTLVISQLD